MARLGLEDCSAVACWDLTRDRLKADARLKAAGFTLEFFGDHSRPFTSIENTRTPTLRFYPGLSTRVAWANEGQMRLGLEVMVEVCLEALDPRDGMNIQWAIMRALYPDDGSAYAAALVEAGAATGLWQFPTPLAKWDRPKDRLWRMAGVISLEVDTALLSV